MTSNESLGALMASHGLTRRDVARLSGYSLGSVDRWLRAPDNRWYCVMPERALRLLALEVGDEEA